MLDAHRQPQQAVADPGGGARLGAHRGVGHRRRMRDQALDPAQGFGEGEIFQPVDEGAHRRLAAFQFETEHRAEAFLLTRGDGVPRMRLQPRPVQRAHRRVPVQQLDQRLRVLLMHAQPRIQGAQAAQGEEAVERRAGQAQRVRPPHQLRMRFGVLRHHRAADHIAVAIDVLGGGMHHVIGAEGDRRLQRRREESVVDHGLRPGGVRGVDHEAQIGDPQQRVRRGFDPDHRRADRQRLGQRARVGEIDRAQRERALLRQRVE
jgi:hypothetical protein